METEPITKAQIKAIWTLARNAGLDRDTLYAMIPGGSMRALTRGQAGAIIERLSPDAKPKRRRRRTGPASPNVRRLATPKQRAFLRHLFEDVLGWKAEPGRIAGFVQKTLGVSRLQDVAERGQATKLITAAKAYLKWLRERGLAASRA